jgi:FtsX extracellular domain
MLAASACSGGVVDGRPSMVPALAKSVVPAEAYEVAVFLCPDSNSPACPAGTAKARTAAVGAKLNADPDVAALLFVSVSDSYHVALLSLSPRLRHVLHPGDLPAVFLVRVSTGRQATRIAARYSAEPGVTQTATCRSQPVCQVAVLRQAGVIP